MINERLCRNIHLISNKVQVPPPYLVANSWIIPTVWFNNRREQTRLIGVLAPEHQAYELTSRFGLLCANQETSSAR